MKVKELIEKLQRLDPEAYVWHSDGEYGDDEPVLLVVGDNISGSDKPLSEPGTVFIWQ